jgi:RNA polymerase sigma-70 factor (ECF subfamily)
MPDYRRTWSSASPAGLIDERDAPADCTFAMALAAAKAGEEWALTLLYRDTQPAVVRYLKAHAPGEEEDLASEVWIAVARQLEGFVGGPERFRGLVFTIARRRAIDASRRRSRRRTDAAADEVFAQRPGGDDPEGAVIDRLSGDEAVRRLFAILPAGQAEVVLLRVVSGMSVSGVAEVMGRRPGAISVVQHRALRRLARYYRLGPSC